MTWRGRFFLVWATFVLEAIALALLTARGAPVQDVAILIGLVLGVPFSCILAAITSHKPALLTIIAGTLLVGVAFAVTMIVFDGNPLALAAFIMLGALGLWLTLPDVPRPRKPGTCERCGYDRAGLAPGAACPECGAP